MKKRHLTIFLILLITITFSQDKDVWTVEKSFEFKSVGSVDLSKDGKQAAYVVREAIIEKEKSSYLSHIWLTSTDGKINFQLTRGKKSAGNPKFSPDGSLIAFTTSRSGKNQIWLIRTNGGEAYQLTKCKNGVASFKWSPDGSKIAYTMRNPATKCEEEAKKGKNDSYKLDENFKFNHLYTIKVKKSKCGKNKVQRLTKGDFHILDFDWSPDSEEIVFTHSRTPF